MLTYRWHRWHRWHILFSLIIGGGGGKFCEKVGKKVYPMIYLIIKLSTRYITDRVTRVKRLNGTKGPLTHPVSEINEIHHFDTWDKLCNIDDLNVE